MMISISYATAMVVDLVLTAEGALKPVSGCSIKDFWEVWDKIDCTIIE